MNSISSLNSPCQSKEKQKRYTPPESKLFRMFEKSKIKVLKTKLRMTTEMVSGSATI